MPVVSVSASIGLAPSAWVFPRMSVTVSVTTLAAGDSAIRKTRTLTNRRMTRSIVLLEIETRVHRGHLIAVAVEHQRRPARELADPPLAALRPARVIDGRVDVGVEPV